MRGKDRGKVSIHIMNEGINAFQPELYGKIIIVEKTLTQSSTNSCKMKAANGSVISTKTSEVCS